VGYTPPVDRIRLLENPIRHYAWGSRTFFARLQGRSCPSREPEAELWIGAHPLAPSLVVTESGSVPLPEWIARDPEAVLGSGVAARFAGELPFLLKILAVEEPLSLQAHPDADQARAGFERESRAGTPLDAPERCYRDARAKPELVCALGRFRGLKGFRPPEEILARMEKLGVHELEEAFAPLRARPDAAGWRESFQALWSLPDQERETLVARTAAAARSGASDLAWVARLADAYPGDLGALAPLYLNVVELQPGEALFLPAGELHSYLEGVAVEVMASSDNVLRGGLTPKHVDVPELLRVLRFEVGDARHLDPSPELGAYDTPVADFQLCALRLAGSSTLELDPGGRVEILLCTAGGVALVPRRGGSEVRLARGGSCLIPAGLGAYRVRGPGMLFRVCPGPASPAATLP
jgi:mannose-6-phosphate isomerase